MRFHRGEYKTEQERFWAKVEVLGEDDCWPWLASTDQRKYGMFSISRREGRASTNIRAHRYSLELKEGRHLLPREEACHTCDNPICCNPTHLFVGSHDDNMKDCSIKGRIISPAKLTEAQVQEATALRVQGVMVKDIAELFGVSSSQMSRLTRGKRR